MRTKSELDSRISAETALIKQLEGSYPDLVGDELYHKDNLPYHIHHTRVRDAYWRRRRLIAERDSLPDPVDVY